MLLCLQKQRGAGVIRQIKRRLMDMSVYYAIGVMVGAVLVALILRVIHNDGKVKTEYDERQLIVRGKSYTYAFWGMLLSNAVMMGLEEGPVELSVLGMSKFFIPILIGIIVQISYSIFHDAYKGMNDNMTRYMVIMTVVSVFNLFVGIMSWVRGGFIQDGKVYPLFINLLVGILFFIVVIEMIIRKAMLDREE